VRVVLGNRDAAIHPSPADPVEVEVQPRAKRATVFDDNPDDGHTLGQLFTSITHPTQGVWASHAVEGSKPAWVASDSEGMAALLAEHYGGIEIRELEDPFADPAAGIKGTDDSVRDSRRRGGGGAGGAKGAAALNLMLLATVAMLAKVQPWLKTSYGNDFQARQMAGAASATAVARFVGLSANTTAPAAGDTTLTGEIVTAGLTRQGGTYAHTTGVASYTITTTFTAQAADVPVTVGKRGTFEALAGGSQVFSTLITPTATLSAAGDTLTLTDTVTL
jgi:hypothetical protein